jgi:transcriptional regulator GlxA family with amidase domain
METRLSESTLDVETLSHELGMSRVHLHRKLKQLCGQSPSEFIRNFRLERAAALLEKESGNISEVAFAVGFSSLTHFSKCFRNKYGMSPSAFLLAKSEQHERSP